MVGMYFKMDLFRVEAYLNWLSWD